MERKYYVYIIQSKKDKSIYIGFTTNLTRRIKEHNNNFSGYTKSKSPWSLIWYCVFADELSAKSFEKYLKSGSGKAFIQKRIILYNPPETKYKELKNSDKGFI